MSNIDVLAAMDSASINLFEVGRPADGRKLDAARAAVAELIEKVDELLSSHGVYSTYGGSGESIEKGMHSELTAALSRVRGAE